MNSSSFFNSEEMLEQGKSVLQKQAQVTLQTLSAQLTGSGTTPPSAASPSQQQPAQDASASDFVKEIYATSSDQKPKTHQPVQQSQTLGAQVIDQLKGPASQDAERIAQLRKELRDQHTTSYYNPLVTRPKQEERVAEKVEREENEEKQKRWELQEKEQKKDNIALRMSTNKAEQFRGAAG